MSTPAKKSAQKKPTGRKTGRASKARRTRRKAARAVLTKEIQNALPESAQYMHLLEMEKRLDVLIERKRWDIYEALKMPPISKRTLRLFVSHRLLPEEDGQTVFAMRVEGKVLDAPNTARNTAAKKLSSIVSRVYVEFQDKDIRPAEWQRSSAAAEGDGFEVSRKGMLPTQARLYITMESLPARFKLTKDLRSITDIHTGSKPQIIRAVWNYIKAKNLQNPDDPQEIKCDAYLQQAFGGNKTMRFRELAQGIEPHLLPPDPVVISYMVLPTDADPAIYDVEVDMEDSGANTLSTFLLSADTQKQLFRLDEEISSTIGAFGKVKEQRDFHQSFAEDPKNFLLGWIESMSLDQQMQQLVPGVNQFSRRTAFYQQTWTQDAAYRYLLSRAEQRRLALEQESQELHDMAKADN